MSRKIRLIRWDRDEPLGAIFQPCLRMWRLLSGVIGVDSVGRVSLVVSPGSA